MRRIVTIAFVTWAVGAGNFAPAYAQSINGPRYSTDATATAARGYYFWLDGMYDRVKLTTYNISLESKFLDNSVHQTFTPGIDAGGVRGAIGYVIPATRIKLELGGSYVGGASNHSQVTILSGPTPNTFNLCGYATHIDAQGLRQSKAEIAAGCVTNGGLGTDYGAWQINAKVSNDWKYASITVTPSLALFGGNTRVDQNLAQSFTQNAANNGYAASTTQRWADFGARAGADLNIPVSTALAVNIGGWIGAARRSTSVSGTDFETRDALRFGLTDSDVRSVLLAKGEAGFNLRLNRMVSWYGFAGLNYDGSVPGIANPSTSQFNLGVVPGFTANIYYAPQTSYYAGSGFRVAW